MLVHRVTHSQMGKGGNERQHENIFLHIRKELSSTDFLHRERWGGGGGNERERERIEK